MFFNVSNHPSAKWSELQLAAAHDLGGEFIRDIQFPDVPATADEGWVTRKAYDLVRSLSLTMGDVVMVQGEMTLTFAIVARVLFASNVQCVAACSSRVVTESVNDKGETVKTATFAFAGFRRYVM